MGPQIMVIIKLLKEDSWHVSYNRGGLNDFQRMKVSGTKEAQYTEGRTGVKYTESIKITCVHAKVLQLYLTL